MVRSGDLSTARLDIVVEQSLNCHLEDLENSLGTHTRAIDDDDKQLVVLQRHEKRAADRTRRR